MIKKTTKTKKNNFINVPANVYKGLIEYRMTAEMAYDILLNDNTKRHPQDILCEYVNDNFGLNGYCICVKIFN